MCRRQNARQEKDIVSGPVLWLERSRLLHAGASASAARGLNPATELAAKAVHERARGVHSAAGLDAGSANADNA